MIDNQLIYLDSVIFSLQRNGGISVYWGELLKGLINKRKKVLSLGDDFQQNGVWAELERSGFSTSSFSHLPARIARYLPVKGKLSFTFLVWKRLTGI